MTDACSLPPFKRNLFSGSINLTSVTGNNLDEVFRSIKSALEGSPFSTDFDNTDMSEEYKEGIEKLADTVVEKLNDLVKNNQIQLPFVLNRTTKFKIREYIKQTYLPKVVTPIEENILAVIPGQEIVSETTRRSIELDQVVQEIFEDNLILNTFRQSLVKDEIRTRTIINVNDRVIVDDPTTFNNNIAVYQNEQYTIIREFLELNGFDVNLLPETMYTEDDTGLYQLNRSYRDAMQMLYNYIKSKKSSGELSSILEQGWIDVVKGNNFVSLYRAVNAYINLEYFDNVMEECFGDFISINKNYDAPITEVKKGNRNNFIYKYSFKKKNSNRNKNNWEDTRDALKEMSKFQQLLIESIPIYDYTEKSVQYGRLQSRDFIGSFSMLLDIGTQVPSRHETFIKAISERHTNPNALFTIFNELFTNNGLIEDLKKLGLDRNNINYLYSIYMTVFSGDNSWKSIEDDYIREKGMTTRYFLIDTLFGVIDSNVSANYVESTFNHDTREIETSIKSRYSTDRTKFDIVNNINNTTVDNENKKEILNLFKLEEVRNEFKYIITLPNADSPIRIEIIRDKSRGQGLLHKSDTTKNLSIPVISKLKFNISTKSDRERLLSRENLSKDEQILMSVLDFIDTMLGTYFGRDIYGLQELYLLTQLDNKSLFDLFVSASRALLVTDIYNKFESAVDIEGNKYARNQLLKYLSESYVYSDKIQDLGTKEKREFFITRHDGEQLSVLRANQKWIRNLAKVRAIMMGNTSVSVTTNVDGNKLPNYSPTFLGANLDSQLEEISQAEYPTTHLIFSTHRAAIKAKTINTDVITNNGVKKQVRNMTSGELLYDAIVNKFIVPYLQDQTVYTQPTVYSDKTKFLIYQIQLSSLGINSLSADNFNTLIERQIIESIGKAYKEVYERVKEDYKKIFPDFVSSDGELDLDAVQNWLKTHTQEDFVKKAQEHQVTVYKDIHYREIKDKKLSINELLYEYANNLYTPEELHSRLEKEKLNFINELLNCRVTFPVDLTEQGDLDEVNGNQITKFLAKYIQGNTSSKWVKGNRMILAKVTDVQGNVRNITYGKINLKPGETFEINPLLNAYFMIDNLIGNNLRFSLTGSEINHKVKMLSKLDLGKEGMNLHRGFISKYNPSYDGGAITFYDVAKALENFSNSNNEADVNEAKAIRTIYNKLIYRVENGAQNAQFKRNVIIPGTMRPYLPNRLNGIRRKMNIAIIDDVGAQVFNFEGKKDKIDAHDGSAFVNPFSSILENMSLQDSEVGTVKKPIQHWYDARYMSATLLKYAVDTITNRWMLQAEGNDLNGKKHGIVLRNIFKKMTNVRWHNPDGSWKFGRIDLINGCGYTNSEHIDFFVDILEKKPLFYRDGIKHVKISEFGYENEVYYTIEEDVDSTGHAATNKRKVYHYFDNVTSEHVTSPVLLNRGARQVHTIDSLFELHTALGGIYSESRDDNGNLQYSEASNYAVVNFMNRVATLKEGADPENLTQDSYYQPLKEAMIDVLANNSATKNGAGNINPTSSYYDDTDFYYIEVGTEGYGIQMDADHEADEAHMTEFSQVISSLDAGGRLHDYVSQIYETLGKLALDLSSIELEAVDFLQKTGNKTKLYDIVGRTIINNLNEKRGQAGLASAILKAIKQNFNLNTNHELDEFKIPFSDPNIYSTILSTFVSIINKKSIKRQYPGLGTVMVPAYDISMIYDINGKTYQYEDLIRMAINAGFTSNRKDLALRNREIVQQFLRARQNEQTIYYNQEIFQPTDNVRISYTQLFNVEGLDNNLVEYEIVDKPRKSDPTKVNKALNVYIKGQKHLGYFQLVKDDEDNYYSVHFKTGDPNTGSTEQIIDESGNPKYGSTSEQRAILYQQLYNAIPDGAKVSTYGNISNGGLYALNKLMTETIFGTPAKNIVEQRNFGVFDRSGKPIEIPVFQKLGSNMTYEQSTSKTIEVSLNGIDDYYLFKTDIVAFLNGRGIINPTNISYQKNVMVPRNLAPAKISWEYDDVSGNHHYMNIFDHWRVRELFRELQRIQDRKNNKEINSDEAKALEKKARNDFNIQQAFDEISQGIYVTQSGMHIPIYYTDQNGNRIEGKAQSTSAELIMSNLYKSKFGLDEGDSFATVRDAGEDYFIKSVDPIISDNYDLVYTKANNKNLYITFRNIPDNSDSFDSRKRNWRYTIKRDYEYPEGYTGERKIVSRVFNVTSDNVPLFEVGREIINTDVQYDKEKGKYISISTGKILENQNRFSRLGEDQVVEYVEFVSQYQVTETLGDNTNKYILYNINKEALSRLGEDINLYTSTLLSDIYHTSDFNGLQLNSKIPKYSSDILKEALGGLADNLKYNTDLYTYIKDGIIPLLKASSTGTDGMVKLSDRVRNNLLGEYQEKLLKRQHNSFLKSQEVTASRIPAQTLQSFMQMHCVGFTGTETNQCFVSHWQTW